MGNTEECVGQGDNIGCDFTEVSIAVWFGHLLFFRVCLSLSVCLRMRVCMLADQIKTQLLVLVSLNSAIDSCLRA